MQAGRTMAPILVERLNAHVEHIAMIERRLEEIHTEYAMPDRDELVKVLRDRLAEATDNAATDRELVIRYVESVVVYDDHVDVHIFPQFLNSTFLQIAQKAEQPSEEGCKIRGSSGVDYIPLTNFESAEKPDSFPARFRIPRELVA